MVSGVVSFSCMARMVVFYLIRHNSIVYNPVVGNLIARHLIDLHLIVCNFLTGPAEESFKIARYRSWDFFDYDESKYSRK